MRWLLQLLVILFVAGILTVWVFLFDKTQDVDRQSHYDLLSNINELKRLDTELTRDIILLRLASDNNYDELTHTLSALKQANAILVNTNIENIYQYTDLTAEQNKKSTYLTVFKQKQKLVNRFKSSNGILTNSINYMPISINELILLAKKQAKNLPIKKYANHLLLVTLKFAQFSTDGHKQQVIDAIRELKAQLQENRDEQIQVLVDTAVGHAHAIIKYKTDVDQRLNKLADVSPRIALNELATEYNVLQEKRLKVIDQYRFDLVVFSAGLLVILAIIGYYLKRSYRQLQVANETLEKRVEERTSELSQAYQQLKASQAHLVQSEKMASLGQMVAGVAHEVNTPLGYVKSNVELMRDTLPDIKAFTLANVKLLALLTEENIDEAELGQQIAAVSELSELFQEDDDLVDEMSDFIKESLFGLENISELVMGLKNFSRMDRATTDNVDLHECIDSTLAIAKNKIKNVVDVKKSYGDIPHIECSPSQINQVLLNLITNAAHAISKTSNNDKKGTILLKTTADQTHVYIEVIDNGEGMPKAVLAKIFDPFFTTKAVGEGTGLGLSISYKIIQEHGGLLSAASVEGKGSKFKIVLPLKPLVKHKESS